MRLRSPGDAPQPLPAPDDAADAAEEETGPADDVAAAMTALWTPLPGARRDGTCE